VQCVAPTVDFAARRIRAELLPRFPLGRIGRPEDAAALVAFLCSDDGGWITGQVISISGGFSMV